jgi:hypothetical protein
MTNKPNPEARVKQSLEKMQIQHDKIKQIRNEITEITPISRFISAVDVLLASIQRGYDRIIKYSEINPEYKMPVFHNMSLDVIYGLFNICVLMIEMLRGPIKIKKREHVSKIFEADTEKELEKMVMK